ncbi:hypothetical protein LTS07_003693 [Exophiala sideris]|uniref:Stress-associated endoplasmic reticulum protein n=1 Tax=Exophiala sideris TaxID=1016849 RepID=A0ABR0JGT3_9EURO|nr:hypothetical protein LTS07_003693 [Exophiala sideris]KAK5042114.1 hypothetical protein LTR13_001920 [Exophiala sideris]KAK5063935.1 hypothetical protein LTR69_003701 [Exophiala sideris]KAK5185382.1 hypothetical protein LTR44_002371 [Eurotiomycetes sp. CCFEE 6388]
MSSQRTKVYAHQEQVDDKSRKHPMGAAKTSDNKPNRNKQIAKNPGACQKEKSGKTQKSNMGYHSKKRISVEERLSWFAS